MFSTQPYYAGIIAECSTILDAIIFVCVMKPSVFHSLCAIPLISATVDIRNTILRDCGRVSLERWQRQRERGETEVERAKKKRKRKKWAWLEVITNADGYEAKADGVSDWLLSPALHDRYKANTELSPLLRWHRVIETCQPTGLISTSFKLFRII